MSNPKRIIPIPSGINEGLSSAKNSTMLQIFGMPRDVVTRRHRAVTNEPLKSLIVTEDVGPFRATGVNLAVTSLREVLAKVKAAHPDVYDAIGYSGMLNVRLIRGSRKLSNHSWGCAVDINIRGALDGINKGGGTGKRDGETLEGLALMAPFFNEAGWYWGVGFSTFEDGMHFEVADETIREWKESGKLGEAIKNRRTTSTNLSRGDRGQEVRRLQKALAKRGYDIRADGIFGVITHGIVIDFQAANGLKPDGIVGPITKEALGF